MENKDFNFSEFITDSKEALMMPDSYFTRMPTEGGIGIPVIKALIYGAIAGVFNFLWSILIFGQAGATGGIFGGAVGVMAFFGSIIGALIGLFIGAIIILILVAIAGGRSDFGPVTHVTAALMVVMPISAFLNVFGAIHTILASVLSLAVNLYALWMLFHAMTKALDAKVDTSKILMYVMGGLLILFFFIGLATRNVTKSFMRDIEDYQDDFGERTNQQDDPAMLKSTHNDFYAVYQKAVS